MKAFLDDASSNKTVPVNPGSSAKVKVLAKELGIDDIGEEGTDFSSSLSSIDVQDLLSSISQSDLLSQLTSAITNDILDNADYTSSTISVGLGSTAGDDVAITISIYIEPKIIVIIISDDIDPEGSISIFGGGASTDSVDVLISLSATDNVGVIGYYLSESPVTPSIIDLGWVMVTTETSYDGIVTFTLSSTAGLKTIYAYFKDGAGNVSTVSSATITLTTADTTAPSGLSISIESGAASTTNTSVTIAISGTDDVGVTAYYLSESSTTPSADASRWVFVSATSISASFSTSASFELSGSEGIKTVYLWLKDASDNISSSASDTITLESDVIVEDDCSTDDGDTFSTATLISTGTSYNKGICSSTDDDYFKFTTSSAGTITVSITGLTADIDVILYNSSQSYLGTSNYGGTTSEDITYTASSSGTFYVYVYGYNGATSDYTLLVTFTPTTNQLGISLIDQVNVGTAIGGIALSPDDSKLYAALWEDQNNSRVLEYSLPGMSLLQTITFGSYHTHGGVVISSDGNRIFTPNYYYSDVSQIELNNGNARTDLSTANSWPANIDITPDKTKVLVSVGMDGRSYDMGNDSIAIYDISSGNFSLLASVGLSDEPSQKRMAFSEDNLFAYVTTRKQWDSSKPRKLYEISLASPYEVTRTMTLSNYSTYGASGVASIGDQLFVSNPDDSTISVVSRSSWVKQDYQVDGPVGSLVLHPDGQYLFAVTQDNASVIAFDINSMAEVARYDGSVTGIGFTDIQFNNDGTTMYVSIYGGNGEIFTFQLTGF